MAYVQKLTFKPAFDFDQDSCYNAPAVGSDGVVNPGRDTCDSTNTPSDPCHQPSYLESNNVYVRSRCNNGWCAQLWGYYYEVDSSGGCGGHRHDWEHVVIFTEGEEIRYVAASAHGGYETRAVGEYLEVNGHPKIVYHKDGDATHAHRFAKDDDEPPENATGEWFYGDIIDYNGFPSDDLRAAMIGNDWGNGKIDFSDVRISDALELAKGGNDIPLDTGVDEEGSTGRPC